MSGHSKWANIKNKKGKADATRGKIFTKIGREISVAVKSGGSDPDSNSKLRDAIAKAKANNMPNDKVKYAVSKAAGDSSVDSYEEITYEGYGAAGVAVIVETLTDNRNRTAGDVRHAFDKHGGNMGANGCVSWMFKKKGVIVIEREDLEVDEDTIMMQALEIGADDVDITEETFEVTTEPDSFSEVREGLEKLGYNFVVAEIQMIPDNYSKIDEATAVKMERMLDMFEDNDDVQNVWHNAEGLE